MAIDAADLDRFGIDADDPHASDRAGLARYLSGIGVSTEEIRAADSFDKMSDLAWTHVFGIAGPRISIEEASRRTGMPEEALARVLRGLGFSDADLGRGFREYDLDTLQLMSDAQIVLGVDQVAHLSRVIGSSMARIAESSAASMRVSYETPVRTNTAYPEWVELIAPIVRNFLERLTKVMDITLRHHLRDISARNYAVDSEGTATTMRMAIGFADMVGFTARSGASSTKELAGAIDEFEGRVTDTVASSGGRVVKFIGDEVMFAFEDPRSACRCALDLLALAADDTIPEVRVGLSYGEVVNRYGDYYGPVVNLASRLVDFAPAGGILTARELADEARDAFAFEPQDPHHMKGIEAPVEHLRLLGSD